MDIDLVANSVGTLAQGVAYTTGGGTNNVVISAGGDYLLGTGRTSAVAINDGADLSGLATNDFLYLTVGAAPGGPGGFNGGKFVIKLYGASF